MNLQSLWLEFYGGSLGLDQKEINNFLLVFWRRHENKGKLVLPPIIKNLFFDLTTIFQNCHSLDKSKVRYE